MMCRSRHISLLIYISIYDHRDIYLTDYISICIPPVFVVRLMTTAADHEAVYEVSVKGDIPSG